MMCVDTPAKATATVDAATTGSPMITAVDVMTDSSYSTLMRFGAVIFGVNEAASLQSSPPSSSPSSLRWWWRRRWRRCGDTTKTKIRRTANNRFSIFHPPIITLFLSCMWVLLLLSSKPSTSFVVRSAHNGCRDQRQALTRNSSSIMGSMNKMISSARIKKSFLLLQAEAREGGGEGAAATIPVQKGDDHDDDDMVNSMIVGLGDRFDRWRYLQNLLEGDADPFMTHQILYKVLDGALKYRRPRGSFDKSGDDGGNEGEPPVVELEDEMPVIVRAKMEALLSEATNGRLEVFAVENPNENSSAAIDKESYGRTLLKRLEELLPDPSVDEDAHKSLWDTVLEIHGRESVKMEETQNPSLDWRLRNVVARILIHHDFLTLGIVDGPLV